MYFDANKHTATYIHHGNIIIENNTKICRLSKLHIILICSISETITIMKIL